MIKCSIVILRGLNFQTEQDNCNQWLIFGQKLTILENELYVLQNKLPNLTMTSIKVTIQTVTSFCHGNTCIAKNKNKINLIFTGKNYSNLWIHFNNQYMNSLYNKVLKNITNNKESDFYFDMLD